MAAVVKVTGKYINSWLRLKWQASTWQLVLWTPGNIKPSKKWSYYCASTLKILDHSINTPLLACEWRKEKHGVSMHAAELNVHDAGAGPDLAWWPEGPWSPDRGWTCCPHASPRCELGGPGPSPHPPPPLLPLGVPGTSRSLGTRYWTEHQHASLWQYQPFIPPSPTPLPFWTTSTFWYSLLAQNTSVPVCCNRSAFQSIDNHDVINYGCQHSTSSVCTGTCVSIYLNNWFHVIIKVHIIWLQHVCMNICTECRILSSFRNRKLQCQVTHKSNNKRMKQPTNQTTITTMCKTVQYQICKCVS